jgi:hypothetical protein
MMQPQAPVFIDLKAGGLGPGSYPVEVGVALPEPLAGEGGRWCCGAPSSGRPSVARQG